MSAPADCFICGKVAPLGGVPDDVGRPVHYLCRGLRKLQIAEEARITSKRVAKEGKPSPKREPPAIDFSSVT